MPSLIDRDFKNIRLRTGPSVRRRPRRWHGALAIGVIGFAVAVTLGTNPESSSEARPLRALPVNYSPVEPVMEPPIAPPARRPLALPDSVNEQPAPQASTGGTDLRVHEVVVAGGDTLSAIFDRVSVPQRELIALIDDRSIEKTLRRIRPGERLRIAVTAEGRLQQLVYEYSEHARKAFNRTDSGFQTRLEEDPIETRLQHARGRIEDSLFLAATGAGLTDNLTMELATIFGWDIDFALDVRAGDRFSVVYEARFKRGEPIGHGAIVAAEFVNQGRTYRAIRFTDPDGRTDYYDPDGNSVRKAFLRTPVDFARISSRFSTGRKHPVLNRMRAHRGVDYAAPTGTAVRSTGDGKIEFVGRKGGYGKVVIVKHTATYSTLYAHLSGFARGMRPGRRVSQGQVIGKVGQTGLATGPHLHYEFRVNGVQRNPLTVKLPGATPVNPDYREAFERQTAPLVAQLDTLARSHLAARDAGDTRLD